jgi:hypothetical protein
MQLTSQQRQKILSATITHTLVLVTGCCGIFVLTASASDPAWWDYRGAVLAPEVTTNSGVVTTNYIPNNYAVVTQGQLKQFTAVAVQEMNADVPGGAGATLNNIVIGWQQDYATNGYSASNIKPSDYALMNAGQLKYIGNLVWIQLVASGYTNTVPTWLQQNTNSDNAKANLGQLKEVFNFDSFPTVTATPPAAPSNLTITPSNSGELDLSWSNNANNATDLTIMESTDGGVTWTPVAHLLDPTIDSYAVTGLTNGMGYQFKLTAHNALGSAQGTELGSSGGGSSGGGGAGSPPPAPSTNAPSAPAPRYAVIDLGTNCTPDFLNNSEQVVISLLPGLPSTNWVLWDTGTTTPITGTGSNALQSVVGIDDHGNVVGTCASGNTNVFWGAGYGNDQAMPSATNSVSVLYDGSEVFQWTKTGGMSIVQGTKLPSEITNYPTFTDVSQLASGVAANGTIFGWDTEGQGAPAYASDFMVAYRSPVTWSSGGSETNIGGNTFLYASIDLLGGPYDTSSTEHTVPQLTVTTMNSKNVFVGFTSPLVEFPGYIDYVGQWVSNETMTPYEYWGDFWGVESDNYPTTNTTVIYDGTTHVLNCPYVPSSMNDTNQAVGLDSNNNMVMWDGTQGYTPVTIPGGSNTAPVAINYRTGTYTSGTQTLTGPASQIISSSSIWDMNPATAKFGFPQPLTNLIATNSGWGAIGANALNTNGAIVGTATKTSDSSSHGVLLLLVVIQDVQVPTSPVVINAAVPTGADPTKGGNEIAYIIADDGTSYHEPKMPQLTAQVNGMPGSNLQVNWKLDANFTPSPSGNPGNTHFPNDSSGNPTTRLLPITTPWNIYQEWSSSTFFGGNCTLSFQILQADGKTVVQDWQSFTFQILGNNPDPATCKAQIIANEGSLWYAWAVAKHESGDSSSHPYYNQFANGTASGGAGAHGAKGNPFYAPSEGDGWGLFQLDTSSGLPVITNYCWSWQANMEGWISGEYPGDLQIANNYVNGIQAANPSTFQEPVFVIQGVSISGRDAAALSYYNAGNAARPSVVLHFDGPQPSGQRWTFTPPNAPGKTDSYVNEVISAYNGG